MSSNEMIIYEGIPMSKDVYVRGLRLIRKYGYSDYFHKWWVWQLEKQMWSKS